MENPTTMDKAAPKGRDEDMEAPDNRTQARQLRWDEKVDGLLSWIICLAVFYMNGTTSGIATAYGALIDPLSEEFQADPALMSMGSSLMLGLSMLLSPVASALVNRFGGRSVALMGAALNAAAIAGATFAQDSITFIALYGVVGGIGGALQYVPSLTWINFYFARHRGLATGISLCGSSLGSAVMTPLQEVLIEQLGWRVTVGISAALVASSILCGLAYKKPSESTLAQLQAWKASDFRTVVTTTSNKDPQNHPGDKKGTTSGIKAQESRPGGGGGRISLSHRYLDWDIVKDPIFVLCCVGNVLVRLAMYVPYNYLLHIAHQKSGINYIEASSLLTALSAANAVGRLVCGVVASRPSVSILKLAHAGRALCGVCAGAFVFCSSLTSYFAVSAFYGFSLAFYNVTLPLILCELFGIEKSISSAGLVGFFSGIATIGGPPLIGWFYEWEGNPDYAFWICCALLLLSAMVGEVLCCVKLRADRRLLADPANSNLDS